MPVELLLDILLSAIVLYVYHSDCAPEPSFALEFAGAECSPEAYDFSVVPVAPIATEWALDEEPIAGPVPDELVESIGGLLGLPTTCIPVSPTIRPTVKQLRTAAKLLGVKNGGRLSKAELLAKVGGAMSDAALSELPIPGPGGCANGDVTLDLSVEGFSIT